MAYSNVCSERARMRTIGFEVYIGVEFRVSGLIRGGEVVLWRWVWHGRLFGSGGEAWLG